LIRFAEGPGDTEEVRSTKVAVFLVSMSCSLAGLVWGTVYVVILGWGFTAALPFAYSVIVGTAIVVSHIASDHRPALYAQIVCIIGITTLIQLSMGGVFASGFVFVWAFIGPLTALMFTSRRESMVWFAIYLATLLVTISLDDAFLDRAVEVSRSTSIVFFAMNLGVMSAVVFLFSRFFVSAALTERERANRLLLNVLPAGIAERLKHSDETIASHAPAMSVMFADIVGSTPLFEDLEPAEVVAWLNEVYSALDEVVDRHGLEKIRTIGDNYMVAAGIPDPRADHAVALVQCAIDMRDAIEALPGRHGRRIRLRFGINSGAAVAGVIGRSKFHYDVWGDTVNIASRMESHGEADRIHVTDTTRALLGDRFKCVSRGLIDVKGKGEMTTWWVDGVA